MGKFDRTSENVFTQIFRLGCLFTLIRRKCAMKTAAVESGYESVYFKNGTTSHLSFSSCKQQKTVRNRHDSYSAHDFYFVLRKPRPRLARLPVLPYSFNLFLTYRMNQCKRCYTMNRVNVFEKVFLKIVLVETPPKASPVTIACTCKTTKLLAFFSLINST